MNLQETEKLLIAIQDCYPNQFKDFNEDRFSFQVNMWQRQFENYTLLEVFNAFQIHLGTSQFAPMPCHFHEIIARNRNPEIFMTGEEAWGIVSEQCVKHGFTGQSQAYSVFNERMKRAIKNSGGWWTHCYSERIETVKQNFIKAWELKADQERKIELIPPQILSQIQTKMSERIE